MSTSLNKRRNFALKVSALWAKLRHMLGLCFIGLGMIGLMLPLIPAIPYFVLGAVLLGVREPLMPSSLRKRKNFAARFPTLWAKLRHMSGLFFIGLGVVGLMIPLTPGLFFFMFGVALLGRRNPALRWCMVLIELKLRRIARTRQPFLDWSGRRARRMYRRISWRFRTSAHVPMMRRAKRLIIENP